MCIAQDDDDFKPVGDGLDPEAQHLVGWRPVGDVARTLTKRLVLDAYVRRELTVEQAQSLIDRLEVNEA